MSARRVCVDVYVYVCMRVWHEARSSMLHACVCMHSGDLHVLIIVCRWSCMFDSNIKHRDIVVHTDVFEVLKHRTCFSMHVFVWESVALCCDVLCAFFKSECFR